MAPDCVYTDPLTEVNGWQELLSYMVEFQGPVPGGHFVTEQFTAHHGVIQQERSESDRLVYHAAVAVTAIGSLSPGMVALEIPETRYAKFSHRGPTQNLDRTVSYVYATRSFTTPFRSAEHA